MILSRTGVGSVVLPDDMQWVDEHQWTPLVVQTAYTLTGSLVVEPHAKQAGRPITLRSPERAVWVTRSTVETLRAWASVPGVSMTWTFRGVSRVVMFAENGVAAEPVIHIEPQQVTDYHLVTLRMFEV